MTFEEFKKETKEREKHNLLRRISASLEVEVSDLLESGITLEEIEKAVKENYGANRWKFSRTEPRYTSCIMAIFEQVE